MTFQSSSPPPSLAIPLPASHIQRTESELQLSEDMAAAEYRDYCMFNRLVSGIRQRQHEYYVRQTRQDRIMTPPGTQSQCSSSTNDQDERRMRRMRTPASVPPTKNGPGAYMKESEQSIQNIILTRRSTGVRNHRQRSQDRQSAHVITPPCPMYGLDGSRQGKRAAPETIEEDHDWSIEGFANETMSMSAVPTIKPGNHHKPMPHKFPVLPAIVPPQQGQHQAQQTCPAPSWWVPNQTEEDSSDRHDDQDELFDMEM